MASACESRFHYVNLASHVFLYEYDFKMLQLMLEHEFETDGQVRELAATYRQKNKP